MSRSLNCSNEAIEAQARPGMLTETELGESSLAERDTLDGPPPLIPEERQDQIPINLFTGNQSDEESRNSPMSCVEQETDSRCSKRARSSCGENEDGLLMTVALGPIEHMEIPELDTVDSMINHSLKQFETWENIGTKLEISLEGLIKRVEGIAAVSLPLFPKDSLGDKKDQSIDPGSDKREIDVQVDLPFEEETSQMVELKKLVDEQQRSLHEKTQELESANKTIKQKDIGFAAATALLGLSFEECVRKSAEVTVARAAIMPPPSIENALPASPAPPPPATPVLSAPAQPTTPVTPQQVEARCSSSAAQPIFSRSVSASSVPTGGGIAKDEYSRLNRRNTNGLYEGAFPLHPELMKRFATGCSAAEFVKLVLEHCYTDSYLANTTLSRMNDAQVEEITNVTMTHFTEFRTRKDTTPQMMNRPQVRLFITQVLQNRKKAAKRRI